MTPNLHTYTEQEVTIVTHVPKCLIVSHAAGTGTYVTYAAKCPICCLM